MSHMQPGEDAVPLLIGTVGWEFDDSGDAGAASFYPEDLPPDWRFAFYSNRLRAVYVPGAIWQSGAHGPAEPLEWAADCDEGFRFVIELPSLLARPMSHEAFEQGFGEFTRRIEPLHHRIAGWCLRVEAHPQAGPHVRSQAVGTADTDWLSRAIATLGDHRPVCVDLPEDWPARALAVVVQAGAGLVWRPEDEADPETTGNLLIARQMPSNPRALRATIERLVAWRTADRVAGLFIEPAAEAPKRAEEARLIAELLGV